VYENASSNKVLGCGQSARNGTKVAKASVLMWCGADTPVRCVCRARHFELRAALTVELFDSTPTPDNPRPSRRDAARRVSAHVSDLEWETFDALPTLIKRQVGITTGLFEGVRYV
jgi:hypothetical protein